VLRGLLDGTGADLRRARAVERLCGNEIRLPQGFGAGEFLLRQLRGGDGGAGVFLLKRAAINRGLG